MDPKASVRANEVRSTGPKWNRWPSDLPHVAYVTKDGAFLCVTCANGGNGSLAANDDVVTVAEKDADPQWRVIGAQSSDGTAWYTCAHCERAIPARQLVGTLHSP